jgi:hypothetical protein
MYGADLEWLLHRKNCNSTSSSSHYILHLFQQGKPMKEPLPFRMKPVFSELSLVWRSIGGRSDHSQEGVKDQEAAATDRGLRKLENVDILDANRQNVLQSTLVNDACIHHL